MATLTPTIIQHPSGLALTDPKGKPRGFIDPKVEDGQPVLDDLWIMQGSLCDLKCKHCYTASSPTAGHLEQIAFQELRPHLEDAARFGVRTIYFTGGEVFVNDDVLRRRASRNDEFLQSLEFALDIAPVEILTNARRHIRSHFDDLARLRARHGERLRLRITLESPRKGEHDAIRGRGTFQQTMDTILELAEMGFVPIITAERPLLSEASQDEIRSAFTRIFAERGVAVEVNLIANMLEMGHRLVQLAAQGVSPNPEVFVTDKCLDILGRAPESIMCHYSRCIQKVRGAIAIYPCPVIYDDPRFELGRTIQESFRRVYMAHKNCYDYCLKGGGATCRTHVLDTGREGEGHET